MTSNTHRTQPDTNPNRHADADKHPDADSNK